MRAVKSADYRVESGQSRFSAHATETSQEASSESSKDWHGTEGLWDSMCKYWILSEDVLITSIVSIARSILC